MVMFQSKHFRGLQRAYERGLSESGGNPPKKLGDNMQFFRPMNLSGKLVGGFNRFWKIFSQWEGSSHILWKIKHVPTTNQYIFVYPILHTHTLLRVITYSELAL